jgi:hypothetical protein
MTRTRTETRWVIIGPHGLYTGQYITRKDAIIEHEQAFCGRWAQFRRLGDRCVKATITWEEPA